MFQMNVAELPLSNRDRFPDNRDPGQRNRSLIPLKSQSFTITERTEPCPKSAVIWWTPSPAARPLTCRPAPRRASPMPPGVSRADWRLPVAVIPRSRHCRTCHGLLVRHTAGDCSASYSYLQPATGSGVRIDQNCIGWDAVKSPRCIDSMILSEYSTVNRMCLRALN